MPGHASTSTVRPNIHGAKVMLCIWWDQLYVVYYELFKQSETITGDRYRTQSMGLSRALKAKRQQLQERHDKVILQHDNVRLHVRDQSRHTWKRWNRRSYSTHRSLQTLSVPNTICFNQWHTAWLISISALMKKSKNRSIRGSPQKTHRFFKMVSDNWEKDEKK